MFWTRTAHIYLTFRGFSFLASSGQKYILRPKHLSPASVSQAKIWRLSNIVWTCASRVPEIFQDELSITGQNHHLATANPYYPVLLQTALLEAHIHSLNAVKSASPSGEKSYSFFRTSQSGIRYSGAEQRSIAGFQESVLRLEDQEAQLSGVYKGSKSPNRVLNLTDEVLKYLDT